MSKISMMLLQILMWKKTKKITDLTLKAELNESLYKIRKVLNGKGEVEVFEKIYNFCENYKMK